MSDEEARAVGRRGLWEVSSFERARGAGTGQAESGAVAGSGHRVATGYARRCCEPRKVHPVAPEAPRAPSPQAFVALRRHGVPCNTGLDQPACRHRRGRAVSPGSGIGSSGYRPSFGRVPESPRRARLGDVTVALAEELAVSARRVAKIETGPTGPERRTRRAGGEAR